MIVQSSVEASVSQGELETVVQVQLQLVLGVLFEMTKFAVYAACEGSVTEIFVKSFPKQAEVSPANARAINEAKSSMK